jgi:hypothetical protein
MTHLCIVPRPQTWVLPDPPIRLNKHGVWVIDVNDEYEIPIIYCPWCGMRLGGGQ